MFPVKSSGGVNTATENDRSTATDSDATSTPSSATTSVFDTFHKSVIDWLKDEEHNEKYFVNETEGHEAFLNQFLKSIDQTTTPWTFTAIQHDYVFNHFINHAVRCSNQTDIATKFLWSLSWLMVAVDKIGPYALMNDIKTVIAFKNKTDGSNQSGVKKSTSDADVVYELSLLLKSIKLSLNALQVRLIVVITLILS